MRADAGFSYVELVITLGTVVLVASMAVPATAHVADAARARHAAGFIAARFHRAQQQAVFRARSVGVVFDQVGGRWAFRVCSDEDGDGVLRSDITAGRDACGEGPYDLQQMFAGMTVAVDARLRGPDGEPGSADAVRFGRSDMASFSPAGSCTPGTIFLRSGQGVQYAVRLGNITSRIRVLRYDPGTHRWVTA